MPSTRRWNALSKEYIDHCHAAGIQVFADAPFNVDVNGYRQAIEWGIDLIQTDHPLRGVAGHGTGIRRPREDARRSNQGRSDTCQRGC